MNLSANQENLYVLEQIVEQSQEVFFIYDLASTRFRYLSPKFEELWGIDRHSVAQNPPQIIGSIHPDDLEDLKRAWILANKRILKTQEFRIIAPGQQIKWLSLRTYSITNEDRSTSIAGFVQDISGTKEYTFTLQKYSAKKNSALEILSHDLTGPLSIVQGLSNLILDAAQQYQNEEIEKDLLLIQQTCARCIDLIRDLVSQEFLESVNADLKKERIDLVQKIGIIVDNYRQSERAIAKQFNLAFNNDPVFAEIDDLKFMQVINNLISNSIKFTSENGIVNIFIAEEQEHVEITVEDNGIGIPQALHPFLFDKFTKARRPGLRGEPTVGLGMSIIKRIVELHHGKIWFESEENKGSAFHVRIPKIPKTLEQQEK